MFHAARSESPREIESNLSILKIALQGLQFHGRMLWPVALGVAAATAVIVGALLVGDSVRGSLRFLALDRVGKIDHLLLAPKFFDQSTVEKWSSEPNFPSRDVGVSLPAIVFPQASIERAKSNTVSVSGTARSGNALLLGITKDFWSLGDSMARIEISANEVVLNEALAQELGASVGDKITIRLPAQSAVPADSPLGKRDSETINLPGLKVLSIIANRSLGRFDIRSNQRPSKNAYVAIETIQEALSREGQINAAILSMRSTTASQSPSPSLPALLPEDGEKGASTEMEAGPNSKSLAGDKARGTATEKNPPFSKPHIGGAAMGTELHVSSRLLNSLPLTLSDLGYTVTHVKRDFPDSGLGEKSRESSNNVAKTIFDYFQLTSEQMLIPDIVVNGVRDLWPRESSSAVLTYLANGIQKESDVSNGLSVVYSTISAIDPAALKLKSVGFTDSSLDGIETLKEDEVLVNSWLATRLNVSVGDLLCIDYYLPETVDGHEVERSFTAKVGAVVPLTEPESVYGRKNVARFAEAPTAFNDPSLTPDVPGITDQASMSDWDLPFVLTRTIPPEDDAYWKNHRLTPKLFLPLVRGQALFGSRFGSVSAIRLSTDIAGSIDEIQNKLAASLRPLASELGWQVIPLREQQLAAARGTTPFDVLFLALSFFVILAALILVSLLFRLGIERRASHWGLLLSLGWPLRRVRYLLTIEGLCLAIVGGVLGVGLGLLYAFGVLYLLHSWWVGAVGAPFLAFFVTTKSLLIGLLIGSLMAWLTIWIATRVLARQPMVRLLRGRVEAPIDIQLRNRGTWTRLLVMAIFLATIGITVVGLFLNGQAAGGAFVGSGILALVGMLIVTLHRLRTNSGSFSGKHAFATSSLMSLAASSIKRNPIRSVLAIGLVSVATLLILSMSLFEAVPDAQGTGGFQLIAESSVPIGKSFSDEKYLQEMLGKQSSIIKEAAIIPLRVREGDDAGCNNLYQATQPRVLGISPRIVAFDKQQKSHETFAWAGAAAALNEAERESRWRLLERDADGSKEKPFPVIIDQNTALWALHLTGGIGQRFAYSFGAIEIHFETIGLLQNTILQGSLVLGEKNFSQAFPHVSGYRSWLVHLPDTHLVNAATNLLETGWADEGMDAIESEGVLRNLLAVQNTYLKAFQSLGALGLLLGTFGLAVVQLRSVMERQTEFGLLRAIGFTRWRIGNLVFLESLILLIAGLGIGCIAAAVALLPTIFHGSIHPNFLTPASMLAIVGVFGILASFVAVRRAMQLKLLAALRGD